jgi:hypothetical protein
MDERAKKFLDAEATALKIAEDLEKLHKEASAYNSASTGLEEVRSHLVELIGSTTSLVSNSYKIIKTLREIGGREMADKLMDLQEKSESNLKQQAAYNAEIKATLKVSSETLANKGDKTINLIKEMDGPGIRKTMKELQKSWNDDSATVIQELSGIKGIAVGILVFLIINIVLVGILLVR